MTIPDAVASLERDLKTIFGPRLQSLVAYSPVGPAGARHTSTLALVADLTADDLRACADIVGRWHEAGLATPLLLEGQEFERSLDAFPLEFGAILADHVVVCGDNPFAGLDVDADDLRRACEVQARSHLLHLREGFVETQGRSDALTDLIVRSSAPLAHLLQSVQRLEPAYTPPAALTRIAALGHGTPLSATEARSLFADYLNAVRTLTHTIDQWSAR